MVTVGIDPSKHVYVAVAVDADGRRLTRPLTVKNDADLIGVLLKRIRKNTDGTPITLALEDGRGFARRLADGLLLTGHEVVWVPTRLMSAHHKLHAATGSKSDPVDTAAVAHTAIATPVWTVTASTTARASCAYSSTHGLTSHGRWSPTGLTGHDETATELLGNELSSLQRVCMTRENALPGLESRLRSGRPCLTARARPARSFIKDDFLMNAGSSQQRRQPGQAIRPPGHQARQTAPPPKPSTSLCPEPPTPGRQRIHCRRGQK